VICGYPLRNARVIVVVTAMTTTWRRRDAALAVLCLAALTINLNPTIMNVAFPSLLRQLDASMRELHWVVGAHTLTFAAFLLAPPAFARFTPPVSLLPPAQEMSSSARLPLCRAWASTCYEGGSR
jgi:hypothetical protein